MAVKLAVSTLIVDLELDPSGQKESEFFDVLFGAAGDFARGDLAVSVHRVRVVVLVGVLVPVLVIVVGDEGASLTA